MASMATPSSPPKPPAPSKKLKIQELREALAARKGPEMLSPGSENVDSEISGSAKVEAEPPIQEPAREQKGKAMEADTGEDLEEEKSSKGSPPLEHPGNEIDAKTVQNEVTNEESNGVGTTGNAPLTDFEKKQRRAERFGVGLQVSEEEKRKLRAARFGTEGSKKVSRNKSESEKGNKSESEKRQDRAARFGIVNDEVKKKARLERFGLDLKQQTAAESKKRNLRAARFQTNVNENQLVTQNTEG